MTFFSQDASVTLRAVRYPMCRCGAAYGVHLGTDACQGYQPVEPIEDLGVRAYTPRLSLGFWRRIMCASIWSIEKRLQYWRERFDRG